MSEKKEWDKMIAGLPYYPEDPYLVSCRAHARKQMRLLAGIDESEEDTRKSLLRNLFASTGNNFLIENSFTCDYGINIFWGENSFANFGLTILDAAHVRIGNNVMIAPSVNIFTATHPLDYQTRNTGLEYAYPVTIGDNVWIGGGTTINPGVTIGNNTVIGSGSVVTKDIPADVVAFGNPCQVSRKLL